MVIEVWRVPHAPKPCGRRCCRPLERVVVCAVDWRSDAREAPKVPPDKQDRSAADWARTLRDVAPYLGIGASLAITVLAGLGVGYVADARFGTSPVFFELGGGLGVVLALYQFFRTVSRK